jgi:hypothetical protein
MGCGYESGRVIDLFPVVWSGLGSRGAELHTFTCAAARSIITSM